MSMPITASEPAFEAASHLSEAAPPQPKEPKLTFRKWFTRLGWRHLVAIIALVFALYPVAWVVGAAFTTDPSITSGSIIPSNPTLDNFRQLFQQSEELQFPRWYLNSMIVCTLTAFFTVLIAAGAAYAFSRFRFKGRKVGMMFLLLVQMFPQFLALVAIFVIMQQISGPFPAIGINTLGGLVLVYLGGALGVNAWLIKGFFDTIPFEIDESAKVDGATHGQVFWGIIMPLAVPVLAVIALLSFIGTLNEYIIASQLIQTPNNRTLALGLQGFISQKYAENWGPFTAGALLAAIPVVILFFFLQKYIVSGLTAGSVKG